MYCADSTVSSQYFYLFVRYLSVDDSTWEGRNTAAPLAPPDEWGAQVVQNEFSREGRQETVPGGGMPRGVIDMSGNAGALRAPAHPQHRGYT